MLCLSRHEGESVVIDLRKFGLGIITVTNVQIRAHNKARLGFDAAPHIPIHRSEVFEALERTSAEAGPDDATELEDQCG